MALELILTADTLASLKVQVAAWNAQLNGGAVETPAPQPEGAKPKAEAKPKAKSSNDAHAKALDEYAKALDEKPVETEPLDYAKDVVSKILAKVAELQAAGQAPADAKAAVQNVIKTTFGVANAKEVPADKWPALLEAVAKVSANG